MSAHELTVLKPECNITYTRAHAYPRQPVLNPKHSWSERFGSSRHPSKIVADGLTIRPFWYYQSIRNVKDKISLQARRFTRPKGSPRSCAGHFPDFDPRHLDSSL